MAKTSMKSPRRSADLRRSPNHCTRLIRFVSRPNWRTVHACGAFFLRGGLVLRYLRALRTARPSMERRRSSLPRDREAELVLQQCAGPTGGRERDALARAERRWLMG